MSRSETLERITKNLVLIHYQTKELASTGLYRSRFTEDLVQQTVEVASGHQLRNLNASVGNFPGIDLRSADEQVGYQATRQVDKAKFTSTTNALNKEFSSPTSRIMNLKEVYVVGLKCVRTTIRQWTPLTAHPSTRIRAVELQQLLDLYHLDDDSLDQIDDILARAAASWSMSLRSDASEIADIANWLDRPALKDSRHHEANWDDMYEAMRDIRRLIATGLDSKGRPIARPERTFSGKLRQILREIRDKSHQITLVLSPSFQAGGNPSAREANEIDLLRNQLQHLVTDLCKEAGVDAPRW
ncbi:SMEK domain-containing protein [Plantibacter flavus]|uniref:SMEK domain-containing protein n=1 Tax=Plantibacter flavus TaxID=150123 RepID=UPI0010C1C251|nr:SMEK domain-containing protein [Plantibacter flavus]